MENYEDLILWLLIAGNIITTIIILIKRKFQNFWGIYFLLLVSFDLLQNLVSTNNEFLKVLSVIFSPVFYGPVLYLLLKYLVKPNNSVIKIVLNLLIPVGVASMIFYNSYIIEEDIMLSILGNTLVDIITIVYVCMAIWICKYILPVEKTTKIIYQFFMIISSLYLFVKSVISIISLLYFTDKILWVNLSVNVPKIYREFWLFHMLSIFGLICIIFTITLNTERFMTSKKTKKH